MHDEYQIWIIRTEQGPMEILPDVYDGTLDAVIELAISRLKKNSWYGVGVKRVGESDWEFVTHQDAPLFEPKRRSGSTQQYASKPLPMIGNPLCC